MNCHLLSIIIFLSALIVGQLEVAEFNETLLTSGNLTIAQMEEICGISSLQEGRMHFGGRDAKPGEWPWAARITAIYPNTNRTDCGGVLINYRFILTAAHCLYSHNLETEELFEPLVVIVKLGHLSMLSSDSANAKTYITDKWIIYSDFSVYLKDKYFDIALIELKADVVFSKWILPICLPSEFYIKTDYLNSLPILLGWDNIKYEGRTDERLQQVYLEVASYSACKKDLPFLEKNQICAKNGRGRTSACHANYKLEHPKADSGGPLMVRDSTYRQYVIGITIDIKKCESEQYWGVFTRVGSYQNWIKENAKMI